MKSNFFFHTILFLLVYPLGLLQAQETVISIRDEKKLVEGMPVNIETISPEYSNLKFRQVQNPQLSWRPHYPKHLRTRKRLWARFRIKSELTHTSDWALSMGKYDQIEVHIIRQNGEKEEYKTGELVHKRFRPYFRSNREGVVPLELLPGEEVQVYFKIFPLSDIPWYLHIQVIPERIWYGKGQALSLYHGIFHGILFIMLVYNLLMYTLLKDIGYLNYCAYIAASLVYFLWFFGYTGEFLLPEHPRLNLHLGVFCGLMSIFYFRFIVRIVEESPHSQVFLKALQLNVWFQIGVTSIAFLIIFLANRFYLALALINASLLIGIILGIVVVYRSRKKFEIASFVLSGNSLLLLGTVCAIFTYYLNQSIPFIIFAQIGVVGEIMLFSLGLGYRLKLQRGLNFKEKPKLLYHLKTKEARQQYENQLLSQEVSYQLKTIEEQKHEITTKNNILEVQHAEILMQKNAIEDKNRQLVHNERRLMQSLEELQVTQEALIKKHNVLELINEQLRTSEDNLKSAYRKVQAEEEKVRKKNEEINKINEVLEQEVRARTEQLNQALRELDIFIYRASHDFRRPLTTLMGISQVADMTLTDPDSLELFEKVTLTAKNMDKMLVKLMMVCDINDQNLEYERVKFQPIIRNIQKRLSEKIEKYNIRVTCEIQESMHFVSNDTLIHSILYNLIENSILFCRPKDDPIVKIEIFMEGQMATLQVSDNGQGIAPEYHANIFDMYFRANEASQGNGLGLYVVKRAIKRLRGSVHFESKLQQSSVFTIQLPAIFQEDMLTRDLKSDVSALN